MGLNVLFVQVVTCDYSIVCVSGMGEQRVISRVPASDDHTHQRAGRVMAWSRAALLA